MFHTKLSKLKKYTIEIKTIKVDKIENSVPKHTTDYAYKQ